MCMSQQKANPLAVLIVGGICVWSFFTSSAQHKKDVAEAKQVLGKWRPEEYLALVDTRKEPPDPRDVQRYASVLDQLESKCFESREEVAVKTAVLTVNKINAGYEKADNFEANLNSLKNVMSYAEGFTDRKGRPSSGDCNHVISMMIKDYKQAEVANEKQREDDAARERQLEREKQEEQAAQQRQLEREKGQAQSRN
jgi:hypothetical protein